MPGSSYDPAKKNSASDATSEYHRDQAAYYTSSSVKGPQNKFGSWESNKGRKDYYRFDLKGKGYTEKAAEHTAEKDKWYQVRDA